MIIFAKICNLYKVWFRILKRSPKLAEFPLKYFVPTFSKWTPKLGAYVVSTDKLFISLWISEHGTKNTENLNLTKPEYSKNDSEKLQFKIKRTMEKQSQLLTFFFNFRLLLAKFISAMINYVQKLFNAFTSFD